MVTVQYLPNSRGCSWVIVGFPGQTDPKDFDVYTANVFPLTHCNLEEELVMLFQTLLLQRGVDHIHITPRQNPAGVLAYLELKPSSRPHWHIHGWAQSLLDLVNTFENIAGITRLSSLNSLCEKAGCSVDALALPTSNEAGRFITAVQDLLHDLFIRTTREKTEGRRRTDR